MTLADMQFISPDLRLVFAEIFVLAMACLMLLADALINDKKRTVSYGLSLITLFGAAVLSIASAVLGQSATEHSFSGMVVSDLLGLVLKLSLYIVVALSLVYSRSYVLARPQMARGEYYTLTLFATLGMMVMICASHMLSIYVGLELLSLSLYALVALNRDSKSATEAAMKYFVLGALASGMLLYGISMVYGATGTLELRGIFEVIGKEEATPVILSFGLVFIVAALAFKLGAVPFHMWIPDVYQGAPTAITLFIASAPKIAAFAMIMRLLVSGFVALFADWQVMLMALAVLSIAVGNIAAVTQTNIKRMLAYSAISHMGFMLLGLISGVINTANGPTLNLGAYSASMFYIITYALTSTLTFGVIMLLSREGFEAEKVSDFAGLNKRNPWFAGMMLIAMFSLAGIPFFVGFMAKFSVLQVVVESGYLWLAVLAVFFSLIGAFYYLRVVKVMYFDAPTDANPIIAPFRLKCVLSANGLALAVFGILPNFLLQLCVAALTHSLFS